MDAYAELLEELEEGETVEGIVFSNWGGEEFYAAPRNPTAYMPDMPGG